MTTLDLAFTFFNPDHAIISNNILYEIRKQVATTFENCGFGAIQEADSKFGNTYAIPVVDNYSDVDSELYIAYLLWLPVPNNHGNYSELVTNGLLQIKHHILTRFHIYTIIRMTFS